MVRPTALPTATAAALLLAACGAPEVPDRAEAPAVVWRAGPALPVPVTNNAVAAIATSGGVSVYSFLGMDSTRAPGGTTSAAYRWDVGSGEGWLPLPAVPGPGRLAATAQVVRGRIYVLGGYTLAADGSERSVGDVNVYDPESGRWERGAGIPTPVDDAVSGVWRDSLIVLVSGWRDDGNVRDVQWYDPATDRWTRGTPIPGEPVFGHSGSVVGDEIVYIDGVRVAEGDSRYAMNDEGWVGALDPSDPTSISWSRPVAHPAPNVYRAASGVVGRIALFVGGTDNPYNYDGIGYDGEPSEPLRQVLAYAPAAGTWRNLPAPPLATMDHRTLGVAGGQVFLVGGMERGQRVTGKVWYVAVEQLLATIW